MRAFSLILLLILAQVKVAAGASSSLPGVQPSPTPSFNSSGKSNVQSQGKPRAKPTPKTRPKTPVKVSPSPKPSPVASPRKAPVQLTSSWPPVLPFMYDITLSWTNAIAGASLTDTPQNPNNVQGIPNLEGVSLLRPGIKAWTKDFLFVARPQFEYTPNHVTTGDSDVSSYAWSNTDFRFNDLYLQWTASDNLIFVYGLQNYQWGPAEAYSPSNTIFHETVLSKDILFEFRGHDLLRANLTPAKDWSFVLLGEVTPNGDSPFIYGQDFRPQVLLKSEHNWNSGADYFGFVLNWQQYGKVGWGEYGNLSFDNGFSLYFDATHTIGSQAWYPITDQSNVVNFEQSLAGDTAIYTLATAGVRYAFTGGTDVRVEYIYDQAAYTEDEEAQIKTALSSADPAQLVANSRNFAIVQSNGQEFPGQNLLYLSARIPEFLGAKDLAFYGRYLHSLTDRSGAAYASLQYEVGGSGEVFAAGGINHGQPVSELSGLTDYTWIGGYKHSW